MAKKRSRNQQSNPSDQSTPQTSTMSDNTNEGTTNDVSENAAAGAPSPDDGSTGAAVQSSDSATVLNETGGAAGDSQEELSDDPVDSQSVSNAAGGDAASTAAAADSASAAAGAGDSAADSQAAPALQQAAPAADARNDAPAGTGPVTGAAVSVVGAAAVAAAAPDTIDAVIQATLPKVTPVGQIMLHRFDEYVKEMAPGRTLSEAVGARHQVNLYRTLVGVINTLDEDFQAVFGAIVRCFVLGDQGVFHETHVYRFMGSVALPEQDRRAFLRILNLIKLLAEPRSRQLAVRQVNLQTSFPPPITERGKQRVLGYFNL